MQEAVCLNRVLFLISQNPDLLQFCKADSSKITIRAVYVHFVPKPLQFSGKIGILLVIPMKWELIAMRKDTIRLAGTAPLFWESNLEVKKLHTTPERSLPRNW